LGILSCLEIFIVVIGIVATFQTNHQTACLRIEAAQCCGRLNYKAYIGEACQCFGFCSFCQRVFNNRSRVSVDFKIAQAYNESMNTKTLKEYTDRPHILRLPKYEDIPNVGLYLDQTVKYINSYFDAFDGMKLTASMVSNYVKKGLVANTVKKQYYRDQIAYLIFIAVAKNVLSMENLSLFISIQKESYPTKVAYDYFCAELENVMEYVFGIKSHLDNVGNDETQEKFMLRSTIIAAAYQIYLDCCFDIIRTDQESEA